MANPFGVFHGNPKDMPGQGLANPDFNAANQRSEYTSLLTSYLDGLDQYGPGLARSRNATLNATLNGRAGEPGLVRLYQDSVRMADPESARLMDLLTQSATNELGYDNQLDAGQTRLVEQSSRASAAARGLGYGPSDAFAESLAKLGYGDQLRAQRRQQALTLQQLRQALAARPVDWATQTSASQSSEPGMWNTLLSTYGQNQENARVTANNETKIGMHQADVWNGWFKMGAKAAAG